MNDGFFDVKLLFAPLSRFTTAPLKGRHKPLLEERWHEVTEWWQKCPLRSECDFRATDDRPYELHIFYISHTYNKLPLRGADGAAV